MTPKEKAIELVEKYDGITDVNFGIRQQKKCALIAVDEVIKELCEYDLDDGYTRKKIDYFKEVKTEIQSI